MNRYYNGRRVTNEILQDKARWSGLHRWADWKFDNLRPNFYN
jgi:hypothetical protein